MYRLQELSGTKTTETFWYTDYRNFLVRRLPELPDTQTTVISYYTDYRNFLVLRLE